MSTQGHVFNLIGHGLLKAKNGALHIKKTVQLALPSVFGMPIKGSLVQLYREDEQFQTVVSFQNYLSAFVPEENISIIYSVTVYDRMGHRIAHRAREVGRQQTLQLRLTDFVNAQIDEYGLFRVDARYRPRYKQAARFLGQTAPQFMTLFVPCGESSGPQMIHSHKHFEYLPVPKTANSRRSAVVEALSCLRRLELFVLNSSPIRVHGRIEMREVEKDVLWYGEDFEIPGHGVRRIQRDIPPQGRAPEAISTILMLDRAIRHRKPIVFRTFVNGVTTCNHT
jgi:hypothetical protein